MYNDRTHTMLDPFPFATSPQVLSQSDLSTAEYSTGFKVTSKPFSSATGVKVLQTLPRSAAGLPMEIVWWEEGERTWALRLVLLSHSGCGERLAHETSQTLGGTLINTQSHGECAGSQHSSCVVSRAKLYIPRMRKIVWERDYSSCGSDHPSQSITVGLEGVVSEC